MEKKTSNFSGQLGFVLAAAGSAVGVGNLWRFPYLAAKDGGGLFLLVYLVLVLTFGFTLLTSDIAIGRRTKKSAIAAYAEMQPKWKFLGILTFLVPVLIMTYYAVIGGWITKYAVVYLTGNASAAAEDGYFTSFITSPVSPMVFALVVHGRDRVHRVQWRSGRYRACVPLYDAGSAGSGRYHCRLFSDPAA